MSLHQQIKRNVKYEMSDITCKLFMSKFILFSHGKRNDHDEFKMTCFLFYKAILTDQSYLLPLSVSLNPCCHWFQSLIFRRSILAGSFNLISFKIWVFTQLLSLEDLCCKDIYRTPPVIEHLRIAVHLTRVIIPLTFQPIYIE